jgi:hypothetical protein
MSQTLVEIVIRRTEEFTPEQIFCLASMPFFPASWCKNWKDLPNSKFDTGMLSNLTVLNFLRGGAFLQSRGDLHKE